MNIKAQMRALVDRLNEAGKKYYSEDVEIMSNAEYDELYDRLAEMEKETGIVMADSPTVNVGYEVVDFLPKEAHESPMLSLDKTKDPEALAAWLDGQKGLLSWKLDGLTVVLTYEGGKLQKAVTRGNGQIGEVITPNARMFVNIPLEIPCRGKVVVRGEAFIRYSDFEEINRKIPEVEAKYKNPRNLCSGSVRQLDSRITKERKVNVQIFSLSTAEDESGAAVDFGNSAEGRMKWIESQGFDVVESVIVDGDSIAEVIQEFEKRIPEMDIPSDGLVLTYEDIAYGQSLGSTAKFPRHSIAFKWQDETAETVLREIEWSPSRTGLINPVAVFEPVELEGSTVSRASVHNVSILKELGIVPGSRITVYKANMIIPQIKENLSGAGQVEVPEICPVCGGKTEIRREADVETLHCTDPECPAKKIKSFALFVSRDALDIGNISEATLEKLVDMGFIKEYSDIFRLDRYKDRIVEMEGFGEKSYENLVEAAEKARHTETARLIYGLGIPGIGVANGKALAKAAGMDFRKVMEMTEEELVAIDGVGDVMAEAVRSYFRNEENLRQIGNLLEILEFEDNEEEASADLEGMTFVVTGSLAHFENRNALKAEIEKRGGKVAGSVSSKTAFLINNDVNSQSSKNKKARELGVEIISEADFMERFLKG